MRVYYVEPLSGRWRLRLSETLVDVFTTKYEALDAASTLATTVRPSIVYLLNECGHLVATWEFRLDPAG